MAAGFSVKDALNKNSKAGIDESPRARFRTKDISIFKMYQNDMNFYSVEQIEELAGDILMYGLKQNLELVYAPCESQCTPERLRITKKEHDLTTTELISIVTDIMSEKSERTR